MFKITKEYDMDYRRLVYRPEEYSFDSIPIKSVKVSSGIPLKGKNMQR